MKTRIVFIVILILLAVFFGGCDYFSDNEPPVIEEVTASKTQVAPGEEVIINVVANDPDGDTLNYEYQASGGTITGTGNLVIWVAPEKEGSYFINVTVKDQDTWTKKSITITNSGLSDLTSAKTPPFTQNFILKYGNFTFIFPDQTKSETPIFGSFSLRAMAGGALNQASLSLVDIKETMPSFFLQITGSDKKVDKIETGEISLNLSDVDKNACYGELDLKTGNFSFTFLMAPKIPGLEKRGIKLDPFWVTEKGNIDFTTGIWRAEGSLTLTSGPLSGVMVLFSKGGTTPEVTAEKSTFIVKIKVKNFPANVKLKVEVKVGNDWVEVWPENENDKTDEDGNATILIPNTSSSGAAIKVGDTIRVSGGGTSVECVVEED